MPPISLQAAPSDSMAFDDARPHGADFVERARQMVSFLAQSDNAAARAEHDLTEWISRWRDMRRGPDATQHFVAEELGIIVRALNGPASCASARDKRTNDMCWRIARCIAERR